MKAIKFNTEMVRAILEGRKTVTRRVIKPGTPLGDWGETVQCCPYVVGEEIYVQEEWQEELDALVGLREVIYRADFTNHRIQEINWYKPEFLQGEDARLFLQVTDVRAENLHEITEIQALCEGVVADKSLGDTCYTDAFVRLWDSIYGEDIARQWDSNPWVWVITFKIAEGS